MATKKKPAKKASKKTKTQPARKTSAKGTASSMIARKDFGAPVASYLAKQPPDKRALLDKLESLIMSAVPGAKGAIKWGRPFYEFNGPIAVLASFKEHVSITFFGSPSALADPKGLLEGTGQAGKHVKVRSQADIDEAQFSAWLQAAAKEPRSMSTSA